MSIFSNTLPTLPRKKRRATIKGTAVKTLLSKSFGSKSQVDLIDFQSLRQGGCALIIVYQHHLTKFCVLRPLTKKKKRKKKKKTSRGSVPAF